MLTSWDMIIFVGLLINIFLTNLRINDLEREVDALKDKN